MSGSRSRLAAPAGVCLLVLSLGPAAVLAARPAEPQPRAEPAERTTALREPQTVHARLQAICAGAGYRSADFDSCAAAIAEACRRSGVLAETARCWQWLVDRDAAGQLDRRSLRRDVPSRGGTAAASVARADGLVEVAALRASGLSAREAAGVLRRAGPMNASAVARALRAARYQPRDIERAVAEQFRLSPAESARVVRAVLRERPPVVAEGSYVRGREVSICVRPDGALVTCAAGSPPSGGRLAGGRFDPGTAAPAPAPEDPEPTAGLGDWMVREADGHHWHNSYVLALMAYYIYSDALGDASTSRADFRALMQSWGMEDVHFADAANVHLRWAVTWGQGLVVVVFRGSEMQATAHCVLEMMFPGLCADLPANWVTNLSFVPMRQRPEWRESDPAAAGAGGPGDLSAHRAPELHARRRGARHRSFQRALRSARQRRAGHGRRPHDGANRQLVREPHPRVAVGPQQAAAAAAAAVTATATGRCRPAARSCGRTPAAAADPHGICCARSCARR